VALDLFHISAPKVQLSNCTADHYTRTNFVADDFIRILPLVAPLSELNLAKSGALSRDRMRTDMLRNTASDEQVVNGGAKACTV